MADLPAIPSGGFRVWVTKWVLTDGNIHRATAWPYPGNDGVCVLASGPLKGLQLDTDWFKSEELARRDAEKARAASLKSAHAKIIKLEAMTFEVVDE